MTTIVINCDWPPPRPIVRHTHHLHHHTHKHATPPVDCLQVGGGGGGWGFTMTGISAPLYAPSAAIPEPAVSAMLAIGILVIAWKRRLTV